MLVITLAIYIAYFNVLSADFISWDDIDYVYNISDINDGISIEKIKHWFSRNYLGNYQPLPILSYAIDHMIGGTNPKTYHIQNLIWHGASTILVYFIFQRLQENRWVAFFIALIFALHPVQTESVSWVAARNKSMNATFYFASICFYLSYLENRKIKRFVLVVVFGLLAYLCKATALSLAPALFAHKILSIMINQGSGKVGF
jgi:hypothetical protein